MNRYLGQFNIVLKDKNKKKNPLQILRELTALAIAKKELPLYYGGKYLYRAQNENFSDYLSSKEEMMVRFSPKLHKLEYTTLLKNKLASALYFENCGLAVPRMPSYNVNNTFFYEGKQEKITTTEELTGFFEKVLDESGLEGLFIKALAESGGIGCYMLRKSNLAENLREIAPILLKGAFIHQEILKQHGEINKIYPHSINTLRLETYIDKTGKTHVLAGLMRFGIAGNFVDNASSGGFYASVDMERGMLRGKGFQKMKAGKGGGLFEAHPDTGHIIDGTEIPFFEEAVQLALDGVEYVPDRYIGWDIAVTQTGPVLIEGNGSPHVILADIAYGGYLKHPLYGEILEEAKQGWSPKYISPF